MAIIIEENQKMTKVLKAHSETMPKKEKMSTTMISEKKEKMSLNRTVKIVLI